MLLSQKVTHTSQTITNAATIGVLCSHKSVIMAIILDNSSNIGLIWISDHFKLPLASVMLTCVLTNHNPWVCFIHIQNLCHFRSIIFILKNTSTSPSVMMLNLSWRVYCILLYCIYSHVPTYPYKAKAIGYRTSHTTNLL
jgi:hypothetical protein